MENIFENAYFGKMYKTRDGRRAIFNTFVNKKPQCLVENDELYIYAFSGVNINAGLEQYYKTGMFPATLDYELNQFSDLDIVSEWK